MESAISTLTQFYTSKEGIERFVDKVVSEVEGGNYNALHLKVVLKGIQKSIKEIDARTKELSLNEAEKYGSKSFEVMGAKVEISELGTKYDYANCGDPVWNKLDEDIKRLTEEKKTRETFLKTIKDRMSIADETSGGEIIDLNPVIKTSTTGIKITIK